MPKENNINCAGIKQIRKINGKYFIKKMMANFFALLRNKIKQ